MGKPEQMVFVLVAQPNFLATLDGRREVTTMENTDKLHALMRSGWRVVSITAMGGAGQQSGFASTVLLEKE